MSTKESEFPDNARQSTISEIIWNIKP